MKKILLIAFLLIAWPTWVWGACPAGVCDTDSTPNVAEVTDLVATAITGDTIRFQGDATGGAAWSTTVTVDRNITIDGNGHTLQSSGALADGFFKITGFSASSLVRITGFTFNASGAGKSIWVIGMTGGPTVGNIRIDNNTFNFGTYQVDFNHGKGLVDNNYFYNATSIAVQLDGGTRDDAEEAWESLAAGTINALVIEDNHFIQNASGSSLQEQIASENGGKFVIRYNHFDGTLTGAESGVFYPIMTHGNADGGCGGGGYWAIDQEAARCRRRGQSVVEIYENQMDANRFNQAIVLRGSANLVYNNTLTKISAITPLVVYFVEEEYDSDNFSPLRTARPGEDQVHNSFVWNNTLNGVQVNTNPGDWIGASPSCSTYPASCSAGLQRDQDYFIHAPCASTDVTASDGFPCTHGIQTFTGLNGASNGNPTDGSPYPTYGSLSFTPGATNAYYNYTPLTYNHPLRGGSDTPAKVLGVTGSGVGKYMGVDEGNINWP